MSKNEWKKSIGVVGRMLLAYALLSQGGWAGQDQKTKGKADSPQKAAAQQTSGKPSSPAASAKAQSEQIQGEQSESSGAEEKRSRDGSHQGIKVHGHWTIDVRNPDGGVVTHREFENSLQSSGSGALASILAGTATMGLWAIRIDGSGSTPSPCLLDTSFGSPVAGLTACDIIPGTAPTGPSGDPNLFFGLSVNTSATGLVLSGTAKAAQNGGVASVSTYIYVCQTSSITTSDCFKGIGISAYGISQFTGVVLPLAQIVPVSTGQIISVTVNISFS